MFPVGKVTSLENKFDQFNWDLSLASRSLCTRWKRSCFTTISLTDATQSAEGRVERKDVPWDPHEPRGQCSYYVTRQRGTMTFDPSTEHRPHTGDAVSCDWTVDTDQLTAGN